MKKKIIALFLTIVVVLTTSGCNKLTTYEELNYNELMNKIEQKEDFILMIGSSQCSHCSAFKKTLEKVIENYQIKIYYINIYNLTDEEDKELSKHFYFSGTPTTVFVENGTELKDENGNIKDRIDGNRPYKTVIEKLRKLGYVE